MVDDSTRKETTLVSFAAGKDYYFSAADRLEKQCEALNVKHDIVRIRDTSLSWAELCRTKVKFLYQSQKKHGAIYWTDVDSELLQFPERLRHSSLDMMGYLGGRQYIRDFDPMERARFWVPSNLYFGDTPAAREFLETMVAIDEATNENVTDDWILHEAWLQHEHQMHVGFLPPLSLVYNGESLTDESTIRHGASGEVSAHKALVLQHPRGVENRRLRAQVFAFEALQASRDKNFEVADAHIKRALELDPSNEGYVVERSKYMALNRDRSGPIKLLVDWLNEHQGTGLARLELGKRFKQARNFPAARRTLEALVLDECGKPSDLARSILFDLEFDERAQERGIATVHRPKVWWMKTPYPGNFGDVIGPFIVESVLGEPPVFSQPERAILSVGSIAKRAGASSVVWGAGISERNQTLNPDATYLAVRGPHTRDAVLSAGGKCPEIFGDPALLLPEIVPPSAYKKYKLGFIRHVNERLQTRVGDGVTTISLVGTGSNHINEVVEQITSCEYIVSTSLHGIIVAHAYGIPARWAVDSSQPGAISGDGIKFEDYFLGAGVEIQKPLDLASVHEVNLELVREVPQFDGVACDLDRLVCALRSAF